MKKDKREDGGKEKEIHNRVFMKGPPEWSHPTHCKAAPLTSVYLCSRAGPVAPYADPLSRIRSANAARVQSPRIDREKSKAAIAYGERLPFRVMFRRQTPVAP